MIGLVIKGPQGKQTISPSTKFFLVPDCYYIWDKKSGVHVNSSVYLLLADFVCVIANYYYTTLLLVTISFF